MPQPSLPEAAEVPASVALAGCTFADLKFENADQPHRIFLYRPSKPVPPEGWPVLYLTDGNACFATAVDALKVQASYPNGTNVGEGVVVAIGYPTDEPYDPLRRSWDLSPPPGRVYPPFFPDTPDVRTGGGEHFLALIENELKPWVEEQVPIDRSRQTLFGHSFGGLFVLYALLTKPAAFNRWISASPAIYWEDAAILSTESAFLDGLQDTLDIELHLSAGQYEGETLAPFHKGTPEEQKRLERAKETRTVQLAREMARRWAKLTSSTETVTFEEYAGENHMSVLPVALNRAVQIAFRGMK
ncbi:alpha/beta hydrolase [Rhizobium sp. P40RR-XXII]|uniref:alpha/beta hydrolase n=1 Tax=unclassified Rhizobium TaxID=2613769 RepID=UPI0014563B9E|nr:MULTISPECIES: alpha/beta hydrolase-fold protein [unclassified Rhizobium]NLR88738.1 alpha/beta hydrolase [Rhizobium sp. P28RR-XV]NLS20193.1 alpha/beta hydrolase [Rhizobium sp. P40RR-XXII]